MNEAIKQRLDAGTYCSLVNPQEVQLAQLLLDLHPWAGKVRYARGGGEAMAIAVRIGRAATGKSGVAFCGYHGWHDWYLAANLGENNALDGHLIPGLQPKGVPRELKGTSVPFKYNDYASFETALIKLGDNAGVVVMEPMRSQMPLDDFVIKVAAKCKQAGIVFIIDEITSGLRYGFPGAHCQLGVQPDIAVYAKAMSNGVPFATIVGSDQVMQLADDSFISSSYWTDGIGTAAALAVLEKMKRLNVQEIVWNRGLQLQQALRALSSKYPLCGLMVTGMPSTPAVAFSLGEDSQKAKTFYVRRMHECGFLVSSIYYLMLAHEDIHINQLIQVLSTVLSELSAAVKSRKLDEIEQGNAQAGFARLA